MLIVYNCFDYCRKENRTATNNKLVKIDRRYNDKKLTTGINSAKNLKRNWKPQDGKTILYCL